MCAHPTVQVRDNLKLAVEKSLQRKDSPDMPGRFNSAFRERAIRGLGTTWSGCGGVDRDANQLVAATEALLVADSLAVDVYVAGRACGYRNEDREACRRQRTRAQPVSTR